LKSSEKKYESGKHNCENFYVEAVKGVVKISFTKAKAFITDSNSSEHTMLYPFYLPKQNHLFAARRANLPRYTELINPFDP